MKRFLFTFLIFSIVASFNVDAQTSLNNPGFEDEPSDATTPMGWMACERGTTPDIFPGVYGIYKESSEGETYVGLITRADGSFESIGQRLSEKLIKSNCYFFNIDLSKAEDYVGYNESIKLRVWLGNKKCRKDQMIFESEFIDADDWESKMIKFIPEQNSRYILLEAYHPTKGLKGHILIDNMTNIMPCLKV